MTGKYDGNIIIQCGSKYSKIKFLMFDYIFCLKVRLMYTGKLNWAVTFVGNKMVNVILFILNV